MGKRFELHIWETPVITGKHDALGPIPVAEKLVLVQGVDFDRWVRSEGEIVIFKIFTYSDNSRKQIPVGFWVPGSYLKVLEVEIDNYISEPVDPYALPNDYLKDLTDPIPEMPEYLKNLKLDDEATETENLSIESQDATEVMTTEDDPTKLDLMRNDRPSPRVRALLDDGDDTGDDVRDLVKKMQAPAPMPILIPAVETKEQKRERELRELGDSGHAEYKEKTGELKLPGATE